MVYKIEYPYYGITSSKDRYFVIVSEKYAVVIEHNGTHGFGFSAYVSREKILKLFRFSHQITKQEFDEEIKNKLQGFFKTIPGVEVSISAAPQEKLRTKRDPKTPTFSWCSYYGYEPNENLERYLSTRAANFIKEQARKNKNKTMEQIETDEMLEDLKRELFKRR